METEKYARKVDITEKHCYKYKYLEVLNEISVYFPVAEYTFKIAIATVPIRDFPRIPID